jgi:hypothetical protein
MDFASVPTPSPEKSTKTTSPGLASLFSFDLGPNFRARSVDHIFRRVQ